MSMPVRFVIWDDCRATTRQAFNLLAALGRRLRRTANRARALIFLVVLLVPLIWLTLVAFNYHPPSFWRDLANNPWIVVVAVFLSLLDIGLGFIVLITLEAVTTTHEEFLENVIEMLRSASSGDTFVLAAPTFNVQAIANQLRYLTYRSLLSTRQAEGVNVIVAYYANTLDPSDFFKCQFPHHKMASLEKHRDCDFVDFHWRAIEDAPNDVKYTVEYFESCYQFLQELRDANVTERVFVQPAGSRSTVHPFFIGNTTKDDYFFGTFTVNESLPQAGRVSVHGNRITSAQEHIVPYLQAQVARLVQAPEDVALDTTAGKSAVRQGQRAGKRRSIHVRPRIRARVLESRLARRRRGVAVQVDERMLEVETGIRSLTRSIESVARRIRRASRRTLDDVIAQRLRTIERDLAEMKVTGATIVPDAPVEPNSIAEKGGEGAAAATEVAERPPQS